MDAGLAAALEGACMDAIQGDPPGASLARRLERTCVAVLRSRCVAGARVSARSGAEGTFVEVLLPRPGRPVERVVLTMQR